MLEQIKKNRNKSVLLLISLIILIVATGYFIVGILYNNEVGDGRRVIYTNAPGAEGISDDCSHRVYDDKGDATDQFLNPDDLTKALSDAGISNNFGSSEGYLIKIDADVKVQKVQCAPITSKPKYTERQSVHLIKVYGVEKTNVKDKTRIDY